MELLPSAWVVAEEVRAELVWARIFVAGKNSRDYAPTSRQPQMSSDERSRRTGPEAPMSADCPKAPVAKAPPASQPDTTLPLYETTGKEKGECQDL